MSRLGGRFTLMAALGLISASAVGWVSPAAPRTEAEEEGRRRAAERQREEEARKRELYAALPVAPETRQQRRARERAEAKAARS